jgi:hypothetical protein
MRLFLCLALLLSAAPLAAKDEVYRWVDAEGVIHYGSRPPSKDAKPAELPQLQTYKAGAAPVPSAVPATVPGSADTTDTKAASLSLRLTAPVEGETFRDPQGVIPVIVAVEPEMPPGTAFVFYLDGVAQNKKPWAAPGYTFTEVERGEHTVSVALVTGEGAELQRTAGVRIYQMSPIARPPPPKKSG